MDSKQSTSYAGTQEGNEILQYYPVPDMFRDEDFPPIGVSSYIQNRGEGEETLDAVMGMDMTDGVVCMEVRRLEQMLGESVGVHTAEITFDEAQSGVESGDGKVPAAPESAMADIGHLNLHDFLDGVWQDGDCSALSFIAPESTHSIDHTNQEYGIPVFNRFDALDEVQTGMGDTKSSEQKTTQIQCSTCQKCFKNKYNLKHHQEKGCHIKNARLDCGRCLKTFSFESYRKRHEKVCKGTKNDSLQCSKCDKTFLNKANRKRHEKICRSTEAVSYYCGKCRRKFKVKENCQKHQELCQGVKQTYVCGVCSAEFPTLHELQRHCDSAHPPSTDPDNDADDQQPKTPPKRSVKCRTCQCVCESMSDLYRHRMMQHGGANDAPAQLPWGDQPAPWENENYEVIDPDFQRVYQENRPHIFSDHTEGEIRKDYHFPSNDMQGSVNEIMDNAQHIYRSENHAFRVQLSFGMILRNIRDGRYRYYIAYDNSHVFERPVNVSKPGDMVRLRARVRHLDLDNYLRRQRPNTSWRVGMITDMVFSVFRTKFVLGEGTLPNFIKTNQNINGLDTNSRGETYEDKLCAFRCLAKHFNQVHMEEAVGVYYEQWRQYIKSKCILNEDMSKFHGLDMQYIPDFEICFKISINVYERQQCGTVIPRYISQTASDSVLYMNIYENHLSYVNDFKSYAKKLQCSLCQRLFDRSDNLKRHIKTCKNATKYKMPGGYYKMAKTVFEELDELNIHVDEKDRFYHWFAVFDMEALLPRVDEQNSPKLTWKQKHIAVSTCLCSNIPEYTSPQFIVNTDEDQLLKEMVTKLLEMCEAAYKLATAKWGGALKELEEKVKFWKPETESTEEKLDDMDNTDDESSSETELDEIRANKLFKDAMGRPNSFQKFCRALDPEDKALAQEDEEEAEESGHLIDESPDMGQVSEKGARLMYKHLCRVKGQLMTYMRQLPVLGFNSSNYDLNLIKSKLFHHLQSVTDEKIDFVVKKNNKYSCIATPDFKFLDIMQYLAPNCSYSKFLSAFKVEEQKGYFAYDWFNEASKLDVTELPPFEAFYSELRQVNVLEEEHNAWQKSNPDTRKDEPKTGKMKYKELQDIWRKENMKTFKDYLKYYSFADTRPFVTAVTKLQQYYIQNDLDLFKIAISVPGLARRILFRTAKESNTVFSLFDRDDEDLYWTFQKNLVGGASIIFKRRHKVGETFIRNQLDKLCQSLEGYDSNSLYLNAISQLMPTGMYVRRLEERGFAPTLSEKYVTMYVWMEWVSRTEGIQIQHKLNSGKEHRVGGYLADGYSVSNHTIYEYLGCFTHGHLCALTKNIKNKKWLERREGKYRDTLQRTAFLKSQGYNVVEQWECEWGIKSVLDPVVRQIEKELFPNFYKTHSGGVNYEQILNAVVSEELYGALEIDLQVPEKWPAGQEKEMSPFEYFSEMSPIFCTTDIPMDVMGEHMQEHMRQHDLSEKPRRLLVGGMAARKIFLASPLLKWYITHGLTVTRIYQVVEYVPKRCFKPFEESVSAARREGDCDPDKEVLSDTCKLIGNSAYGGIILDRSKHRNTQYVTGLSKAKMAVNDPRFLKLTELGHDMYEIESAKRSIKMDMPIQLGFFILGYAKLRMLQWYYDCLCKYIDRSDFDLIESDTDCYYGGFSHQSLEDSVKPDKKQEFRDAIYNACDDRVVEADLNNWFPRKCCSKHASYDKRTSGLFKLEERGTEMIALSSKTYVLKTYDDKTKVSCKGINKKNIQNELDIFNTVLNTQQCQSGVNRGFRVRKDGVYTYEQSKSGFGYFYCKRKVLDDGIHTLPLDLTLTPWIKYDTYIVEDFHPLSTTNTCILRKHEETFNSVEHLFQYERALFHKRKSLKLAILKADCGVTAAKLGHQIENQTEWYAHRDEIMYDILCLKTKHDYEARRSLEESVDLRIVCVNRYEKYWCNGLTPRLTPMFDPKRYPGQNQLGVLWERVRCERRDD